MARRTAYVVGGVPLLQKPRVLRSAVAGGACGGAREERPPVLVVPTTAATRRRVSDADRLWRRSQGLVAGRVSETDGKQRNGVYVGTTDGSAGARGGGRVCVALRWNSILKSLWFGVPIVTWPIYAEQQINVFEMVVDLGLAVELRLDYRDERGGGSYGCGRAEVVAAEEIERAMKGVMDGGNLVRERVREMRQKIG